MNHGSEPVRAGLTLRNWPDAKLTVVRLKSHQLVWCEGLKRATPYMVQWESDTGVMLHTLDGDPYYVSASRYDEWRKPHPNDWMPAYDVPADVLERIAKWDEEEDARNGPYPYEARLPGFSPKPFQAHDSLKAWKLAEQWALEQHWPEEQAAVWLELEDLETGQLEAWYVALKPEWLDDRQLEHKRDGHHHNWASPPDYKDSNLESYFSTIRRCICGALVRIHICKHPNPCMCSPCHIAISYPDGLWPWGRDRNHEYELPPKHRPPEPIMKPKPAE